ncbi:MAG: site-specific integrase, partial [Bacteroides sp.]|nr:site-specific integrase [Bacteroides sp.]
SVRRGHTDGKLFLRLIYNRQSGNITLPYRIDSSEWDGERNRLSCRGSSPDRVTYLMDLQHRLDNEKEAFSRFVSKFSDRREVNIRDILSSYRCQSLRGGLSSFVEWLARRLVNEKRERTARAYKSAWRRLLSYSGKSDLCADDLTEAFIRGFEKHLQAEKCSLNTISFYMRNLRAVCNKGKERGIFPPEYQHPFRHVYTQIAPTRKRALSKDDVSRLNCFDETLFARLTPEEKDALHLFLFSFHACGMSFVDLAYLRKSDIRGKVLSYYRKKTGRLIQMNITEGMQRSIEYFRLRTQHSPYVFPVVQDTTRSAYSQYCTGLRVQNQRLKTIREKTGIRKGLSTHMARHSWATIARSESVSVDVISEALGHSFVSTTYIYLESFGSSVIGQATQKVSQAVNRASEGI